MHPSDERSPLLTNGSGDSVRKHVIVQVTYPKDSSDYEPIVCEDFSFALSLDDLLIYKTDPWWQFVRRTMFLSFWLVLLLIFVTALMLAYSHGNASCKVTSAINSVMSSTTARTDLLSSMAVMPKAIVLP